MNNAEYLRLMKKQREIAKMKEKEIKEALTLEPEPMEEPEKTPDEVVQEEVTQEVRDNDIEPDGENGTAESNQGITG